ncbi:MAG TPA: hypothetical protein VLT33_07700 [Labilithrix sp.]|nr:hypothetical protein [Labilithrix sp.]
MPNDATAMRSPLACALAFLFVAACGRRPPGSAVEHATAESSSATVPVAALPIPPRSHAPEAPPEGWCGETAIQEGLLTLGVWAPQRFINKAGRPAHPDLYSSDIPVALSALGVRYAVYGGGRGFEAFAKWVGKAVDEGDPVIAGVKILPTQHPEWGLDHFVLVVGHGDEGLLVNTTWGSRRWVADTTTEGLSFRHAFYAIRLLGVTLPTKTQVARLAVLDESASQVKLRVTCASGVSYSVDRRVEPVVTVDARQPARFYCKEP